MTDLSVVGTGAMGGALVDAFALSGAEVTIWNRTREKAEALSRRRVHLADSVAETLSSSPLTIVSVSDHELARSLVGEAGVDLHGKVVASTSPATPDEASAFDAVVSAAGGHYLDLGILGSADEVRAGAGVFLVSGDGAAYATHREWFERIGRAAHVDDAPGAAYVSGSAVVLAYLPMAVGLLQGWRICEQQNLSAEWFEDAVLEFYPRQIRLLLDRVTEMVDPTAADVEGSVDVMAEWAADLAAVARGLGLDSGLYDSLQRLFAKASAAGHGESAWTRIAEHTATEGVTHDEP